MLLRKVAAATVEAAMEAATVVVTAAEGIFAVVADTSAVMAGGISAAGILAEAGATSAVDRRCLARLRGLVFAVIVLSQSITPDQTQCGR
jgi:hypothetical protein